MSGWPLHECHKQRLGASPVCNGAIYLAAIIGRAMGFRMISQRRSLW
jgi:hypothetical protein